MRRQLPVSSPLSLPVIWSAVVQATRLTPDPRKALATLLAEEFSAESVVLCGSGTEALQLALRAAKQLLDEPPRTVALPAFTCYDVGAAAVGAGARIALYDLDPATLAPDFDSLRAVLKQGARVVVVSPLYGVPIDWDALERIVAPFGAVAIEDAAQGHGATWRQRPLGSLGKISVLSFGRGKGWTGIRGGALLLRSGWQNASAAEQRSGSGVGSDLKVVIAAVAQWALGRPGLYALPAAIPWLELGETVYRDPSPVSPLTRAAAAMVLKSRSAALREAERRRLNAAAFLADLRSSPHIGTVDVNEGGQAGYLRLPLRLSSGLSSLPDPARAIRLGLAPSYPTTLAEVQEVKALMSESEGRWPGGEELSRDLVTLPSHSRLKGRERAQVLRLLNAGAAPA